MSFVLLHMLNASLLLAMTTDQLVRVLTIAAIALLLAMAGLVWLVLSMSRSLRILRRGAERFALGDLRRKVQVNSPIKPINALAQALNSMADQLTARLNTVERQRNEMGAVLSSMAEGVIAVDLNQEIISLNRSAARMFNVHANRALGRSIQEMIRNSSLHQQIAAVLTGEKPIDDTLILRMPASDKGPLIPDESLVEIHGAALRNNQGQRIGALLVLNDVTQLRRLESVRRDFVANVSHELKTPVSAVKAAAETLLDEQELDADSRQRFLEIVMRQADRLHAIIEDLLSLARIEEDAQKHRIELEPAPIDPVLRAAIETCQARADLRNISIIKECPADLSAPINPPLLEQAVVNLLDNAVKYSLDDGQVELAVHATADEIVLSVRDHGTGIESEHLPRLFERFYRTDKARSRKLGGTGLGLAIVNHIAQAHGGRVSVTSSPSPSPDQGSTFLMHLPR